MIETFFRIRFVTIIAVFGSLLGALLMFVIGGYSIIHAYLQFFGLGNYAALSNSQAAVVLVIESLDNFLFGFVLLYFAYSTYFLFIVKEKSESVVNLPGWLQVEDLGHMKRVLLEVILVLLTVFLLKIVILEEGELEWTLIVIPISIVAIAVSLKLVVFD